MKYLFFSDPHLGLRRQVHATLESSARLRERVYQVSKNIVQQGIANGHSMVCLGDLFDRPLNSEATLSDALYVVSQGDKFITVLGGNHDSTGQAGQETSFSLLKAIADTHGQGSAFISPAMEPTLCRQEELCLIPHHATQESFETALSMAELNTPKGLILCLHCNYDSGLDLNEISLNLPRERAAQLLEHFSFILIGHEHVPRADFEGRLQILGSIHPTSFADISDKFYWTLENGELKSHLCYAVVKHSLSVDWRRLQEWELSPDVEFLELIGHAKVGEFSALTKLIARVWKEKPQLLLVRNSVQVDKVSAPGLPSGGVQRFQSIPDRITQELRGTPLLGLWQRFAAEEGVVCA